jgi:glycosyltransferase involved in cell wall biosynthesis
MKPTVIPKKLDQTALTFLYVGTNDVRKNLVALTRVFSKATAGTSHRLIVKTNTADNLVVSPNVHVKTGKVPLEILAGLYNMCDYVISFTRGEGVGLPMVEASYFGKPVIAHDQGVFVDVRDFVRVPWHVLKSKEVRVDTEQVPGFLKKVFHGTWWEVDEHAAYDVLKSLM